MISLFLLLIFNLAFAEIKLNEIQLPSGFKIELLAQVKNARAMAIAPSGNIYVGSKSEGKVYVIVRENLKFQKLLILAEDFEQPVGVAFHQGDLYFSSIGKIYKLPKVESRLTDPPKPTLVSDKFPDDRYHGWKYIAFGPDQKLYVPVGAPCNVCDKGDTFANIMRMNADGSNLEIVARGVRNSVGFDWHPDSKDLWFTDNGRDMMGDDLPPCELNRLNTIGEHFGFPFCHGNGIPDPGLNQNQSCSNFSSPVQDLGAHVAPLGMVFYTGSMFPKEYQNQVFIAEHGSWNRSKKNGYRVNLVKIRENQTLGASTFAEGWMKHEKVWGRPADVKVDQDGALLVSDDEAGAIYRISYTQP